MLINDEITICVTDNFFGCSQLHNYHFTIDKRGNVCITMKTTYNSPSHPSTHYERCILEIEDDNPLSDYHIYICKLIWNEMKKNNNLNEISSFVNWLKQTKEATVCEMNAYDFQIKYKKIVEDNKKLVEDNKNLLLRIKKMLNSAFEMLKGVKNY